MSELYFLNYNFCDTFAVPEASALSENCDVGNDFCPFMLFILLKLEQWKGDILAFLHIIFLYSTSCLPQGFL